MKKFLSLVLALVMTMSLVTISAGAKDFADDSDIDYQEAVDVISALGIVDGYSDSSFRPDGSLTRGAAAKIICNLILGPTTASALSATTAPFKDVPTTNVFAGYITYCAQRGIISGYGDGTFRPTGSLTGNAFMKMLLGALGYDSSIEGYTGSNWQVNVVKQAMGIGLDDGNDNFVGSKTVTRQEAALYSFNMLQATMVEYDTKTTVNVNGATVTIAGDKAQDKSWGTGTNNDDNIDPDGFVQFAEQYFGGLKLYDGTDDFARPANVWRLDGVAIGTYAHDADATYTAKVESGDIYADLGLNHSLNKNKMTVYVNGLEDADAPISVRRGSDDKLDTSANGVLTEVFYNEEDDTVIVTCVESYVGTVVRSVDATARRDAYVVISPENEGVADPVITGSVEFETEDDFADDTYVVYTYSESAEEVKSVIAAEEVTGTVTRAENDDTNRDDKKALTIGDTRYSASKNVAGQNLGDISPNEEYTVYLDTYGYLIYVERIDEIGDYALLYQVSTGNWRDSNKAFLVFADGRTATVNTAKNYADPDNLDYRGTNGETITGWTAPTKDIDTNSPVIVTYRVDEDGVYTLRAVATKQSTDWNVTERAVNDKNFSMVNDKAGIVNVGAGDKTVLANSATTFVVADKPDVSSLKLDTDLDWTAYTGIKNAPTVTAKGTDAGVNVYWYSKSGDMATIMFIMPNIKAEVDDGNSKALFLAADSVSNLIHDKDGNSYFEYQAVMNGDPTTVKVAEKVVVGTTTMPASGVTAKDLGNRIYSRYSVDRDGIITSLTPYAATTFATGDQTGYGEFIGIDKTSEAYTVRLGAAKITVTVDEDADIFYVNKDGDISVSSYSAIAIDDDDKVYAVVDDFMIQTLVIVEVNTEDDAQAATVTVTGGKAATIGDSLVLTANVTLKDTRNDVITGYQWYYTDAPANYTTVSDVEAHATRIAGATGSTYTVDTSAAIAGRYYYCVVETYNDRVTGDDTAKGVGMSALTSVSSSRMTVIVNFVDNSGRVLGSLAPQELQADPGRNYITMSPATYSSQVASVLPHYEMADTRTQYVNFSANGIAQVDFEVEQTEFEVGLKVSGGFVFRHNGEIVTSVWMKQGESIDLTLGDADLVGGGGGWSTYYAHTSTSGFTVTDRTGTNNHEVAFTLTADTLTSDIDVTFTYDQTANS